MSVSRLPVRNADHVVSDATGGGALHCRHCGARLRIEFPAEAIHFVNAAEPFVVRHESCEPPTVGSGE